MTNSVLYFLSRFSVKFKVGFLILFLITGIVFWNLSYISTNYSLYATKVTNLESLEKVREIEKLIASFQEERREALTFLYVTHDPAAYNRAVEVTKVKLAELQGLMQNCTFKKKQNIIRQSLDNFPTIRKELLSQKLSGTEVVRYYTDGVIKHLIDIVAAITQNNSAGGFVSYSDMINAVEYSALEADLTMAVMGEGSLSADLFEVIVLQSGKAQSELDSFKRIADPVAIKKLYASYRNGDFVEMNIQKENFRNHVFKIKGDPFDLNAWSGATKTYIQNLRLISDFELEQLSLQLQAETERYLSRVYKDLAMLIIPILIVGMIAYFIFLDINIALRTMLDFLSGRRSDETKKDRLLLLKSPSELGQVYRKLFAFNTKINKQFKIIRQNYELDTLTTLPNRVKLLNVLEEALNENKKFSLLYIDIYNFSLINDSFGQSVGNIYLKETADVLKDIVKKIAIDPMMKLQVYRMGSDEFVIVCANQQYISRVVEALTDTYLVRCNGIDMPLTFNFGLAHSSETSTRSSILTQAELAVKDAIANQQRYRVYTGDDSYKIRYQTNLEWVKRIKNAFEQNRFEAYFQPIVSTKDESCSKFEVLIRLREEDGAEVISPIEFLPVLQKMGLEKRLTKVIIDQSFELMRRCDKDIAINMTRDDLDEDMLGYLERSLHLHDVKASSVSIELVETEALLQEQYIKIIQDMKALGFKISIDDFGTGYSNFAYLTQIRPDFLKIDGSLIKDIDVNVESRNIVKGIVDLARSLGITLIAEYVSTPEIYVIIKELGIDYAQGYHFGKAESCDVILEKGNK
ncbi:MAG: EAL domain-containing protein [Sulfurimonadaceae bacterium]